jgi:hypothetical protein
MARTHANTHVIICSQALGGTDVLDKTIDAATSGIATTEKSGIVLVDMFGYDAWSSESVVRSIAANVKPRRFIATLCHSLDVLQYVSKRTARLVNDMARQNQLQIPGYPDVQSVMNCLQEMGAGNVPTKSDYKVCTALTDGSLAINDVLLQTWSTNKVYAGEIAVTKELHNKEFNPENKTTSEKRPAPEDDEHSEDFSHALTRCAKHNASCFDVAAHHSCLHANCQPIRFIAAPELQTQPFPLGLPPWFSVELLVPDPRHTHSPPTHMSPKIGR